jgi:sarcosine oxidase subunit beta
MARTADVVVIGAGINGASIAYNLARKGCRHVVVVEKYLVASGGTGKSAAIVRQHYSTETLVKMVKRCRDIFEHFGEMVGGSAGFVKTGYFFLVPSYAVEKFADNVAMQQRLGVRTSIVSGQEARSIAPQLDFSDAPGIAYEPDSGYADPYQATASYLTRARELGVEIRQMSPVRAVRVKNGAVEAVHTDAEEFATRTVVNVSGPWAKVIGAMANLSYPIQVTREQEVVFRPRATPDCPNITVSDMCNAIYFHPSGAEMLVGRGFPKEYEEVDPDHYLESADHEFIEEIGERLVKRIPTLAEAMPIKGYSGLYDVTPDWHPIIGLHAELHGFVSVVGFSGHGFKLAPVVGEAVAELIMDGSAQTADLSMLSPDRFAKGTLIQAAYGGNRA